MLILIGLAVGAALGLRFKVFVLIPVTCVALIIAVADTVAHGEGLLPVAMAMFSMMTSLQLGYIVGNLVAFTTKSFRLRLAS